MALEFKCSHCNKRISINALPGDEASCPHCRMKVTVPADAGVPPPKPGQAPQYTAPEETTIDELKARQSDELMRLMSVITPWIISGFFHAGLALVMLSIGLVYAERESVSSKAAFKIPLKRQNSNKRLILFNSRGNLFPRKRYGRENSNRIKPYSWISQDRKLSLQKNTT